MEHGELSWQIILWRFAAVLFLILMNAFFVAAEFALVGARPAKLRQKIKEGNRLARIADALIHNLDEVIAATQLGITISSLLVGWIGEDTLAEVFMFMFSGLPDPWRVIASHGVAASLAFSFITVMHVVVGEVMPKTIAIRFPNRTSIFISQPLRICMIVMKPFVWILNGSGNLLLRLVGVKPAKGHQLIHSVEELKFIIDASHEGGALDAMEKDLLHKVFKFGDLVARQVMVPRTDMACIPATSSLQEVIDASAKTGHTRFPIYENDIDNITGILHMKDIVHHVQTGAPFQLNKIMKEVHFVPEAMPIVQLLTHLKQKHTQMVVVVDEFGGTSGLVTLEDVIEEIIGDFYDEHHPAVRDMIQLHENEILLRPRVRIDEINERFQLNLKSDGADTIGGYVLQELGSIPRVGDRVEVPGALIFVEEMSNWKIKALRLRLQPQPVESE